jgi:putrescine transport system substrate-binding protein
MARSASLALALAFALAGCGPKPAPSTATPALGAPAKPANNAVAVNTDSADAGEEKKLFVYNWSDYIADGVIDDFKKATGVEVSYDVFDSNESLQSKLLQGNTGYDVVVPSAPFLERQIKAGVYQKLDKSLLPNLKNMDPELMKRVALHDPDNAHSVNYLWGTSGVGYNEDKIRAIMPNAPVDSLSMLFDPAIIARFKSCGVSILDAPSEVVGTVLIYLGKDANSEKPEDLAAVEKVLASIRPFVRYVNSSKYIEDLANGEICLALGWNGDVLQARDRAKEAGKIFKIKYNIPKEGAMMFFDMLAIPADAKHPKNAHLFINYLMRPEVTARNSNFKRYANMNAASWPLINADVRSDPAIFPRPEVMAKLVPDLAESPQFMRQLTRAWTRFKTGK